MQTRKIQLMYACDACRKPFTFIGDSTHEAKEMALERGWARRATPEGNVLDVCPACDNKPDIFTVKRSFKSEETRRGCQSCDTVGPKLVSDPHLCPETGKVCSAWLVDMKHLPFC